MTPDPLGHRESLPLDPAFVRDQIARFLAEDVGAGDVTTSSGAAKARNPFVATRGKSFVPPDQMSSTPPSLSSTSRHCSR